MLMLPSAGGGSNWAGGSFDPETTSPLRLLADHADVARSRAGAAEQRLRPGLGERGHSGGACRRCGRGGAGGGAPPDAAPPADAAGAPEPAVVPSPATAAWRRPQKAAGAVRRLTIQGLPLIKPPYGRITAFDMDKGDIAWQVAARRDAGQHQAITRRSRD